MLIKKHQGYRIHILNNQKYWHCYKRSPVLFWILKAVTLEVLSAVADDLLLEGRIGCVTCHDILFNPKNKEKFKILYKSNEGSALCLTCHNR
jgi:hypothetical protein